MLKEIFLSLIMLVRAPLAAFEALLARKPYRLMIRLILLSQAPFIAYNLVDLPTQLKAAGMPLTQLPSPYLLAVLAPFFALLFWVLEALLITVFVRLVSRQTSFGTSLLIFAYAQAPYLIALPVLLLSLAWPALAPFLGFLYLILGGWSLIFLFFGVAKVFDLSRGRAVLVVLGTQILIPMLIFLGLAGFKL